jgi:hypothetical protein
VPRDPARLSYVPRVTDALSPLDLNYLDSERLFMGSSGVGEYVERKDVAIVSCGLRARDLNFGFLKPPYADVEATAAAVSAYFAERALPFRLAFRAADRERCAPQLEAAGWRRKSEPLPGMTLALPARAPAPPAGLAVQRVATPAQLDAFREIAFTAFGYPAAAAPLFLSERLLALPAVSLFLGSVDGAPVATSMSIATGGVAGIYWVATATPRRGCGYGEALTWAAAAAGAELGCGVASLQASALGRPVYARMGFAHVLDYERLHPPEA